MGASLARSPRARPYPWGPSQGAGHPVHLPLCLRRLFRGRFPSGPPGGPVGHLLYPPACPRSPVPGRSPSVPPRGPGGRDLRWEVPPALGCPNLISPPPASGRGSGVSRRWGGLARKGGVWRHDRVMVAPPGGPAGWKRCTSRLRSTFPVRLPRGSVSVWWCAVMRRAPGSAARGASGGGAVGGGVGGTRACDPSRESSRKTQVRHLGAGITIVPTRRYRGRSCGSCHRLGHRAHNVVHHGFWGPVHSGAMIRMRNPSRAAFATTSSRRLNGGVRPQGTRRGVVPRLGERVVLPRPVRREAVVRRRRKGIPDGGDTATSSGITA